MVELLTKRSAIARNLEAWLYKPCKGPSECVPSGRKGQESWLQGNFLATESQDCLQALSVPWSNFMEHVAHTCSKVWSPAALFFEQARYPDAEASR